MTNLCPDFMASTQEDKPDEVSSSRAPLSLAAVINWRDLGQWLWAYLPEGQDRGDLIFAAPEPGAKPGVRLPPFLAELCYLLRRRPDFSKYDVVFAWELRAAVATALFCRIHRQRKARTVILAPILKGHVLRLLPLLRFLLSDTDRFVCFSRSECRLYPQLLGLPPDRFLYHPLAFWEENSEDRDAVVEDGGYILALGHSNRDYLTLLKAAQGTALPVVIVSSHTHWLKGQEVPPNVTIRCNTHFHETNTLMAQATFHVIPLFDTELSAGQTVLLRAMAYGKAVVITDTAGVRDYVRPEEAVLLVPPDNPMALRQALLRLWDSPEERDRMGRRGMSLVQDQYSLARLTRDLLILAEELAEGGVRS